MAHVRLSVRARADLRGYRTWLRREAGLVTADRWIDALIAWIEELSDFPQRGTPRPDLGAALRTRVFRRSVTIAYAFSGDTVTVLGVFARGRDITSEVLDDG